MHEFWCTSGASDNRYYWAQRWLQATAYVEHLFETAEPYLDEGRPAHAAKAFQAVVWEMYVAAALLERGHDVRRRAARRVRNGGPDVQIGDVNAWVEAVIATPGQGADAVPPVDVSPDSPMREVPDREMLLRITNAIDEKWRKYEQYVAKGWVLEREPFVIAINGADLPHARQEAVIPRVARAVFGIGSLMVTIDRDTRGVVGEHFAPMPVLTKVSGSEVETVHFRSDAYAGVSALMWGVVDPFNAPDILGRDVVVVHNPFAKNPLPLGWFREGVEYWAEKGVTELHWREWWREKVALAAPA